MTEALKVPATIVIVLLVLVILVAAFILPILFDVFIGRGICKFMGSMIITAWLGESLSAGPTIAGIHAGCDLLPF
jgi:hypothetical protein